MLVGRAAARQPIYIGVSTYIITDQEIDHIYLRAEGRPY